MQDGGHRRALRLCVAITHDRAEELLAALALDSLSAGNAGVIAPYDCLCDGGMRQGKAERLATAHRLHTPSQSPARLRRTAILTAQVFAWQAAERRWPR